MKNIDDILKSSLTPSDEPDFWLNQNILSQTAENTRAPKMTRKKLAAVICSCSLALIIGSMSVYAAWKYLSPDQTIENMSGQSKYGLWNFEGLKEAFSGDNAVYINETQSYGGYDVTLLGITSGKNLAKLHDAKIEDADKSYILFAVEHESLPLETSQDFYGFFDVFPVVMGYNFEEYEDFFSYENHGFEFHKDGVLYYVFESSNLENFADHEIYMCVSNDIGFTEYSYIYDYETDTIARNDAYEGLNALFSLPLDSSKADPKAAKAALKEMDAIRQENRREQEEKAKQPLSEESKAALKALAFVEQITPENINDYATLLTDEVEIAVNTFTPDDQGRVSLDISYKYKEQEIQSHTKLPLAHMFPDGKTEYLSSSGLTDNETDTLLLELYRLNEDGTVTLEFYKPNLPE